MAIRSPSPELQQAINDAARELGVNPAHLATAIAYETIGTFDSWKRGPTTRWGTHRGLIQWGEPQQKQYGVYKGMSDADQMKAAVRYLKDAGLKPGMGLIDIYSAINAGHVGLYNRSDRPGKNVRSHVAEMEKTYLPSMQNVFGGGALANGASQPSLRRGDYTPAVLDWQRTLAANDFSPGKGDAKFGRQTEAQTRAFQRANWLTDDGIVGPQTRFAGQIGRDIRQGSIANPAGGTQVADMSPAAMGFAPVLPRAALFPSGGPVPPMPIGGPGTFPAPAPQPYAGNGPGRAPTGPAPFAMSPTLRTKDDLSPPSAPNLPGALAGLAPVPMGYQPGPGSFTYDRQVHTPYSTAGLPAANPFDQPQPWGEVADQSPATLRQRLNRMSPPDVTGGRNLGFMDRAPVNFSNADDAPQYTPGQLRDRKAAEDFGNFASGVGSFFAPFFGGLQPAQANVPLKSGASAAYGPRPVMPAINRSAPATITPQQFQQRFAPMGYSSLPQDVTYREASLSPVAHSAAYSAPRTISQTSFNERFNPAPARYDPLSSAYVPKVATAVPGVTFASPPPASKLAPSQYAAPPDERVANATSPSSLGGFYDDQTITGVPAPVVKPAMTPMRRVARVAAPLAASAVFGPIGGLLAGGAMRLFNGTPLAQRVGQAITYANAAPRTNSYAASPFTPSGYTAPNFNPKSGGSTYAYSFNPATGTGSYINSAGRTISYNVNT